MHRHVYVFNVSVLRHTSVPTTRCFLVWPESKMSQKVCNLLRFQDLVESPSRSSMASLDGLQNQGHSCVAL